MIPSPSSRGADVIDLARARARRWSPPPRRAPSSAEWRWTTRELWRRRTVRELQGASPSWSSSVSPPSSLRVSPPSSSSLSTSWKRRTKGAEGPGPARGGRRVSVDEPPSCARPFFPAPVPAFRRRAERRHSRRSELRAETGRPLREASGSVRWVDPRGRLLTASGATADRRGAAADRGEDGDGKSRT